MADDWDPRRGGKRPGIAGTYGQAGWGGRPASGRDGWSARGWVDGQLVFARTDVRFRDVDSLKIETVWLNVYLGGTWNAQSPHHLYIDHAVIARQTPPSE